MLSALVRLLVALAVTPQEVERARRWVFQSAAGQALSLAHAHGYRQGYLNGIDTAALARSER